MNRVRSTLMCCVAMVVLVACSPSTQKKNAAQRTVAARVDSALANAATKEATRACGAPATLTNTQGADFDGDGIPEFVTDWTALSCAATNNDVCTSIDGCVRQVWRTGDSGPAPIYAGRARAARIVPGENGPALTLDHSGALCGRSPDEICRVTYRWDARVHAMQETAREILSAPKG